jgi:hypothetical protein
MIVSKTTAHYSKLKAAFTIITTSFTSTAATWLQHSTKVNKPANIYNKA